MPVHKITHNCITKTSRSNITIALVFVRKKVESLFLGQSKTAILQGYGTRIFYKLCIWIDIKIGYALLSLDLIVHEDSKSRYNQIHNSKIKFLSQI